MKKKIFTLILVFLFFVTASLFSLAAKTVPRLIDGADLLAVGEEETLLAKLDEISERQKVDIVIVTVDYLDGKSPMEYADDFFDYNGFGFGDSGDGVLLLVSMEDRDWYISTAGFGITAVTDSGREYMSDRFVPELSDGNYEAAFSSFADMCDDFITQARTGDPYDTGNLPKEPFNVVRNLLIAAVVGFVIALIAVSVMKGQLKTVRFQTAAGNYVKADSLNITESRDLYLYTHLDRRARPKDDDSGGSGTHTSSSGTTHGGGGGKF